jgi:hypothetical protein
MNGLANRIKRRDMHFGIGMGHRTGITNVRILGVNALRNHVALSRTWRMKVQERDGDKASLALGRASWE